MKRIPAITISAITMATMVAASAALAQTNPGPSPGATPNTGVGAAGPTYSAPGNRPGATPSPGVGPTYSAPNATTGASPNPGVSSGTGPTYSAPSSQKRPDDSEEKSK